MPERACIYTWEKLVVHADPNKGLSPPLILSHVTRSLSGRNSLLGRQLLQWFVHHALYMGVELTPCGVSDGNGYFDVLFVITVFLIHGSGGLVVEPQSTGRGISWYLR